MLQFVPFALRFLPSYCLPALLFELVNSCLALALSRFVSLFSTQRKDMVAVIDVMKSRHNGVSEVECQRITRVTYPGYDAYWTPTRVWEIFQFKYY